MPPNMSLPYVLIRFCAGHKIPLQENGVLCVGQYGLEKISFFRPYHSVVLPCFYRPARIKRYAALTWGVIVEV